MKRQLTASLLVLITAALAAEEAPLLEIGANDFRISFQEGTGDPSFDARDPAVAYNPQAHEYMVVWEGEFQNDSEFCRDGPKEHEIYRQRIDAATGELLGSAGTISSSGPTCDDTHRASDPAIAYNEAENEYLVVWEGDDDSNGLVDNEFEIFGQLLDAAGTPVGPDDFRISEVGGTGTTLGSARGASVTWNATENEYLVAWHGFLGGEVRVFVQRVDELGMEQGTSDI